MQSKLITYAERDQWNDFVAASSTSPVLQSFEWGELKAKFGWIPIRLALTDNDKIVAGVSMLKREIPYLKHSIFYAPRGPVIDFSNREVFELLLDAIEEQSELYHAISFKMDPEIPDVPEKQSEIITGMKRLGFVKAHKQVQPRATFFLDLTPDLDSIMKGFEEKTRYNIRLAQKKGVEIKEEPTDAGIKAFYELYKVTAARDNFIIHPLQYYQTIREIMFEKGLGSNFVAYYNGKPVGSVIVFCFGSRVWYMYGASSSEARNVMPNHLLHWHIIQWAKEKNYRLYDLWGIPANPKEGHPLWGVYRFKKGFNGRLVKFIGAYDFPYSTLYHTLFEHGVIWLQNLRSLVTKGKIEDSLSE